MSGKQKSAEARWVIWRNVSLIVMTAIVVGGATWRNLAAGGAGPPAFIPELRGLCPISGVRSLSYAVLDPAHLFEPSRMHGWILLGVLLVSGVLGAAFCGRLCPLGAVQEWVGALGRRVLGKRFNRFRWGKRDLRKLDRRLGALRYVVVVLVFLSVGGWIAFDTDLINPSAALAHAATAGVAATAIVLFLVTVAASFFVERPWCRWLCPYGLVQGTVARLSPWTIRRSKSLCTSCGRCDRACPLNVGIAAVDAVRDDRCNRCGKCLAQCPVDGALIFSGPRLRGRVRSGLVVSLLTIVLFAAPVVTARAFAVYRPAGTVVSVAFDPASLSATMTISALAEVAGLVPEELLSVLGLPESYDLKTVLLDIEDDPEFEHLTVGHIRRTLGAFLEK